MVNILNICFPLSCYFSERISFSMTETASPRVRGFESWSGQTKDYKIGICCISAKHATLRRKSQDGLARNQNNVSEWSDMSTRGLLFQ